ncbi:MAG TPA: hypothetical protein VJ721_03325 [Chthoniobacterales bacterium]|nr:hypothetical protein [Chthoniobacterales bacterium]
MKPFFTAVSLVALSVIPFSVAETPQPDPRLAALIKEIETQQAQIIDNQGKIESKLTTIGEAVRTSRIWSSRSN